MKLRLGSYKKRRFGEGQGERKGALGGGQGFVELGGEFACFQEYAGVVFSGHVGIVECKALICFKIYYTGNQLIANKPDLTSSLIIRLFMCWYINYLGRIRGLVTMNSDFNSIS